MRGRRDRASFVPARWTAAHFSSAPARLFLLRLHSNLEPPNLPERLSLTFVVYLTNLGRGAKGSPSTAKRGRLWLADGSCIRLPPEHRNHVWPYDFVEDRTHNGCKYRMLNVLDEFTHGCLVRSTPPSLVGRGRVSLVSRYADMAS